MSRQNVDASLRQDLQQQLDELQTDRGESPDQLLKESSERLDALLELDRQFGEIRGPQLPGAGEEQFHFVQLAQLPQQPATAVPVGEGKGSVPIDVSGKTEAEMEVYRKQYPTKVRQTDLAIGDTKMDISKLKPNEQAIVQEAVDVINDANRASPGTYHNQFVLVKDKSSGEIVRALRVRNGRAPAGGAEPNPDDIYTGTQDGKAVQLVLDPASKQEVRPWTLKVGIIAKIKPGASTSQPSERDRTLSKPYITAIQLGGDGELRQAVTLHQERFDRRQGRWFWPGDKTKISLRQYHGEVPKIAVYGPKDKGKAPGTIAVQTGKKPAGQGKTEPVMTDFDLKSAVTPMLPKGHVFTGVSIRPRDAERGNDGYRIPFTITSEEWDGKATKPGTKQVTEGYFTIKAGTDTYDLSNATRRNPLGYSPGSRYVNGIVVRGERVSIP